jgi:thiopeptide-type bacteriocin biosynthesis protein
LLQRQKRIRRFFRSVYEPEVRLFGGPLAMDHIHAHFDADSAGWLELDRLAVAGRRDLSDEALALAVMNDLFLRTLGDPGEVWDVWCNLAELRPAPVGAVPRIEISFIGDPRPLATAAERRVLARYARANEALARGLRRLWNRGALSCGLRAILAFVATFHFNRHGLDASQQSRIIAGMMQAWSPRRRLRGADRQA